MKPTTHNKNSSDQSILYSKLLKFVNAVEPGKRPEGEIGSLGTTILASSSSLAPSYPLVQHSSVS